MSTMSDPPRTNAGTPEQIHELPQRPPVRAVVAEPMQRALEARSLARLAYRQTRTARRDLL